MQKHEIDKIKAYCTREISKKKVELNNAMGKLGAAKKIIKFKEGEEEDCEL